MVSSFTRIQTYELFSSLTIPLSCGDEGKFVDLVEGASAPRATKFAGAKTLSMNADFYTPYPEEVVKQLVIQNEHSFIYNMTAYGFACTDAYGPYHVGNALAILAAVAPRNIVYPAADGGIPPTFWNVCVGPTGYGHKTFSVQMALRVLREVDELRILMDPGSAPALVDQIVETPQCLLACAEFGQLLSQTAGAHGYMADFRATLMGLWDNAPVGRALVRKSATIRRKKTGSGIRIQTKNPRFSFLGAVAPNLIHRYTQKIDWLTGFMPRFLWLGGAGARTFHEAGDHPQLREQCKALLTWHKNQPASPCLGLGPDARHYFYNWRQDLMDRTHKQNEPMQAVAARCGDHAIKAALLHSIDQGCAYQNRPWSIPLEAIAVATRLVDLHYGFCEHLTDLTVGSRDEAIRMKVLEGIRTSPGITDAALLGLTRLNERVFESWIKTLIAAEEIDVSNDSAGHRLFYPSALTRAKDETVQAARLLPH